MNTIEEIDLALARLPASPEAPEDVDARATLMWKRCALESAERKAAADRDAAERNARWGLPPVDVPGEVNCVVTNNGRTVYAEVVDGRRVMRLTSAEVRALGPHWINLNPEFAAQ